MMQPEKVECDALEIHRSDQQDTIVDCDVLEAAKENIQPLAGGRRATTLAAVLATPHGRDTRIAQTKELMRARVREARMHWETLFAQYECTAGAEVESSEEDEQKEEAEEYLLDSYVRFVNWTIEHYPQGHSAESGIIELIEEATRILRNSRLAKRDARYLTLWIRYASYVEKPEVIYEFVLANDIGTEWAKLYEEYALVLERLGRRTKADEIYLIGIARKAQPLDHLERRHRDFQKRMMVAAPLGSGETASVPETHTSDGLIVPRRRALGESTSVPSSSSSTNRRPGQKLSSVADVEDVFSASSSSPAPRPNARMTIFVDPSGDVAERATGNPWPEVGTRKERIKENTRQPEKMSGTVLKQRGAAKVATRDAERKAKSAPKIIPFRDPEPVPTSIGSSGLHPKTPGKVPFKPFIDEIPEAQELNETGHSPQGISGRSVPATPRFVPFRDEASAQTPAKAPSQSITIPDTVMRLKAVGGSSTAIATSETEALRKDPFKNYTDL